jgi:SSS family solute:Na+ symporter
MHFALNVYDIVIIVASLAFVSWVGLWVTRKQENTTLGYFLASGRLPWWLIGPSLVATSVSSEQIVGTTGAAYTHGMGIGNWEWWSLPAYTLVMVFFIPVYLKSRIVTVPEYYSRRFGPLCGDIYSWVMLVAYVVVFLVPVLYGGSLTFAELSGLNFYLVLFGSTAIVCIYTVRGGLASVMWTNLFQSVLLIGGGVVLFFLALAKIPGGWTAMMQASPERFHLYRPPGDEMAPFLGLICMALGLMLFYQGTNQVMIQRVLGARSTWDGIMGTIFAGFINFIRPLVTCFLGFIVYHWINVMHMAPPLKEADTAFPFVLRELSPEWGIRGIVLAGFLAAVMSTISALVNSTATIFALDVYKKIIRPRADEQRVVLAGKIASMISLFLACLLAPAVPLMGGMFKYFQTLVTYTATPFISVFLLGLLWRRANYAGALFGLVGGFAIQVAVVLVCVNRGIRIHWLYQGAIAQVITMAGAAIVSLATAPPTTARCATLVWRPSMLSGLSEGPTPWYKRLVLWYVIYAIGWFYIYWRYW